MVLMADVSIPGVMPSDVASGRRPRNRKQTVAKVAAALFAEHGFSVVRMDDIAAANGVTVRALYRHFDNKLALLTELVESSQERFLEAVGGTGAEEPDPARRFGCAVQRLAVASEDTAHFAALWQREARHLERADYARLRDRLTSMVGSIGEMIGDAEPLLSGFQRELRAWATIAVMVAPRGDAGTSTATAAAMALARPTTTTMLEVATIDHAAVAADEAVNRRERLLASASLAFARSGFVAAGIEEIGRPAGITGPSLYRHFTSKNELLDVLVGRRESWLWYEADTRVKPGQSSVERLHALTEAFIVASVRAPELVGAWITERSHVSSSVQQTVHNSINAFHGTWSAALQRARPELDSGTCSRLIALAVQVVEDIVRIRHLHRDPMLAGELQSMVESLLLTPVPGS